MLEEIAEAKNERRKSHDQFIGNIDGLDSAERFRVNTSKFECERFNMKECTDDKNENQNDTQDITDGVLIPANLSYTQNIMNSEEPTYNFSEYDAAEQDLTCEEEHLVEEIHRRDIRVRQAAPAPHQPPPCRFRGG